MGLHAKTNKIDQVEITCLFQAFQRAAGRQSGLYLGRIV